MKSRKIDIFQLSRKLHKIFVISCTLTNFLYSSFGKRNIKKNWKKFQYKISHSAAKQKLAKSMFHRFSSNLLNVMVLIVSWLVSSFVYNLLNLNTLNIRLSRNSLSELDTKSVRKGGALSRFHFPYKF